MFSLVLKIIISCVLWWVIGEQKRYHKSFMLKYDWQFKWRYRNALHVKTTDSCHTRMLRLTHGKNIKGADDDCCVMEWWRFQYRIINFRLHFFKNLFPVNCALYMPENLNCYWSDQINPLPIFRSYNLSVYIQRLAY